MPVHGMGGAGGRVASVRNRCSARRNVVQTPEPHTESATGNVAEGLAPNRLRNRTLTIHPEDDPPLKAVVQLITMQSRDDDR
jgi:hypothetical protein